MSTEKEPTASSLLVNPKLDASKPAGTPMLFRRGLNVTRPKEPNMHQVPRIPLLIDGKETEPGAIRNHNGRPLHTVLDRDALDGKVLHVFTKKEEAEKYYHANIITGSPAPGTGYIDLYEIEDWGGCGWRFPEWGHIPGDFRQYGGCGFLWWGWRTPYKNVQCADLWTGAKAVILCDGLFLGGSWLWMPGTAWLTSLAPWGWNNRPASMMWMYW